jgi:hypothetical protein
VMRHTAATWMLGSRKREVTLEQAAAYLEMTPDMLWKRYATTTPSFRRTRRSGDDAYPESCER